MPLNNFGIVTASPVLYRCAQPDQLGFDLLAQLGVKTIYKVNSDAEFPTAVESRMFPSGTIIHDQLSQWKPNEPQVREAVAQVEMMRNVGGVAIHCTHGRDRTGLLVGAWQLIVGRRSLAAVLQEFHDFGAVGIVEMGDKAIEACLLRIASREQVQPV